MAQLQYSPYTQFDTVRLDITDSSDTDILVTPVLRLIFVPSCDLFQQQFWSLSNELVDPDKQFLVKFTSSLYKNTYPVGNFSSEYGVLDVNGNYNVYNKLDGEVKIEPSLGVPLPDGAYTLTCYNTDIIQDSPVSKIKVYFSRGLPIGIGIVVDLINSQLITFLYQNGKQIDRRQYTFKNVLIDDMINLASDSLTSLRDLSLTYSNFTSVNI